jgi:hypothetical protein
MKRKSVGRLGTYFRVSVRFKSSFHDLGLREKGRERTKDPRIAGTRAQMKNKSCGTSERGSLPNPGLGS